MDVHVLEQIEMLIVETVPKHAGKFIVACQKNTMADTTFQPTFFDSIEDAITDILKNR